jgi:hypothetical protein
MKNLFLCCFGFLLLISSKSPAKAGATALTYDYNMVENLEKNALPPPKITEWAKQKKPIWKKKLTRKKYKPALHIDFEIRAILGCTLIVAGLVFLAIALSGLAWAYWLWVGLFLLGLVVLSLGGKRYTPTNKDKWDAVAEGLFVGLVFILTIFVSVLILFIGGLIAGLAWAWITGGIILLAALVGILIGVIAG